MYSDWIKKLPNRSGTKATRPRRGWTGWFGVLATNLGSPAKCTSWCGGEKNTQKKRQKNKNLNFVKRYDEPLFHAAKLTEEAPPFTDFALFLKKNSSLEEDLPMYTMYTGIIVFLKHSVLFGCLNPNWEENGLNTINTGEGDPYKLATIQSFNGVEEMDHWNASECNKVLFQSLCKAPLQKQQQLKQTKKERLRMQQGIISVFV